jgi:CRISPR-associated protein Cmr1
MAINTLKVDLTTLTPLWTGGIEGKADRLHVTGVMGGLRWWYEAIVRGLGGYACEPDKHSCTFDDKKSGNGLCDACQLFGATGWARRFRLIVTDKTQLQQRAGFDPQPTASRRYINASGRTITPPWYLKSMPLQGHATIQIVANDEHFQPETIAVLLQFLADWANIGAKPQMGFGVVNFSRRQENHYLTDYIARHITPSSPDIKLPSLRNMFFTEISTENLPQNEVFNLKYDLRRLFASNSNLRHFVMGTVKGDRQGSKVMMSYPYDNSTRMRVWGWVPESVSYFGVSRAHVIDQIGTHLKTHYKINYWHEFNSTRDTVRQFNDPGLFLESLLKGEK